MSKGLTVAVVYFALTWPLCASASGDALASALTAWSRVLHQFVDDRGQVAFRRLAKNRTDLQLFVDFIADTSPATHPQLFPTKRSQLAFHVDAYNAMAMHAVLDEDIPASLGGLNKYWFFGLKSHRIGGASRTLHRYETDTIRAFAEPRVHFVLNCMSVGCPRLPRERFSADNFEQRLARETRAFLAESRNLRIDHAERTVWLSEIFDFFPEDFLLQSTSVLAYVNQYRTDSIPLEYSIEFTPYDWTVNSQTRD